MSERRIRGWALALMVSPLFASCSLSSAVEGPFADLRGTWDFTGSQATPALSLVGVLTISGQVDEQIAGSLSWTELDGIGMSVARAGQVSGTVIGMSDVDFDVVTDDLSRRFVAEVTGDTLIGVWVGLSSSTSGEFRAERRP